MYLFLRLLVAHLLGDFPFQVDEISRRKREGFDGQIIHGLVVGLTYLVFLLPFLNQSWIWSLIGFFTFLHVLLDWLKTKIDRVNPPNFWLFCLDQCVHIGMLSSVFLFDGSWHLPVMPNNLLGYLYGSNRFIVIAITYLVATFAGTYFLYSFTNTFFPRFRPERVPSSINFGLLERGLMATVFCFCLPIFYPLVILLFFIRRARQQKHKVYQWLLNCIFVAVIAFIYRISTLAGLKG